MSGSKDHCIKFNLNVKKINLTFNFSHSSLHLQVMKTYHMYHSESISAESKLKEAEKQEEKQIGRGDQVFSIRMEDKYQRRSSVKKIEKMKEKVSCASVFGKLNHLNCNTDITIPFARAFVFSFALPAVKKSELEDHSQLCDWRQFLVNDGVLQHNLEGSLIYQYFVPKEWKELLSSKKL